MIDDLNVIKQHDTQDALGFAAAQPDQLAHEFGLANTAQFTQPITNVVFAGMGGSALAAEFATVWPTLSVPYMISKTYTLPDCIDSNTLVVCGSYSGNTEETLEALEQARQKNAQIAIITHGGKLLDLAHRHQIIVAEMPKCPQPRMGVFYAYRALVEIFVAAKLVPQSCISDLEALVAPLKAHVSKWGPEVPESENYTKQIAQELAGKTTIIYGGPLTYPAAYKWKISINENSKNTAWCNTFPELNHNEFIGWSGHPVEKPFACVNLVSSFEHPRVLKRFELTEKLLSGQKPAALTVQAKGQSVVEHLLYLVLVGDFASMYLAVLNGVDPTPIDLVEKLKKELG